MLLIPGASDGDPNSRVREDSLCSERRNAAGSYWSTSASMAASVLLIDNGPHRLTWAASSASTAAIASSSMIR
jgi:hypothetical protein